MEMREIRLSWAHTGAMNAAIRGAHLPNSFPMPSASSEGGPSATFPPSKGKRSPSLRSRVVALLSCVALAAVLGAAAARAGSCRVLVALGSVDVAASSAGLALNISGIWEFDNVIQVASGLSFNLLLVQGDTFVRLHYPDQAFYGTINGLGSMLDSGLDGNDLMAIEANGLATNSARFVSLEAQRMKVTAPFLTGSGPISVVAYLVLDGDYLSPILSNTITRAVPTPPPSTSPLVASPAGAVQP